MEELCCELDDLVVQYCDTLQQLREAKQRMDNAMREGFYSLSKARNSMGKGQVGALQFDYSKMRAQTHVQLREDQDGRFCSFQLDHHRESEVKTTKTSECWHEGQSRKIADDSTSGVQDLLTSNDVDDETEPNLNPLRWFGILVPQALRHCQSSFVHALDECSHVASLQNKLVSIRHQYRSLLKKKKIQLDDATSHQSDS